MYAQRLAREKASAVFVQRPNDVVLGADTVVVVDDQILEKPGDQADAVRMLRLLSGRSHVVITGVCLTGITRPLGLGAATIAAGDIFEDIRVETTLVVMERMEEEDIRSYVATGEPMDKAGGYAIQGIASRWITRIEGDYSNVVGLPVALVWRMLQEHNVKLRIDLPKERQSP